MLRISKRSDVLILPSFIDFVSSRVLTDMLAPHRKGKSGRPQPRPSTETASSRSSVDENEPQVVLPSSTELFYFYGQSLEQCAKLSTGKALFDLCTLHKKWLRIYAGELVMLLASVPVLFMSLCFQRTF